jgi:hypothetical protein
MCSPAAAGLAISAAGTAYQIMQQQQAVSAANKANDEAAARSSSARRAELARQDTLRAERQGIAEQNLRETGAAGTQENLSEAEAARMATVDQTPTTVGAGGVPQIYSTPNSTVAGDAITAQVAKDLGEARTRLAAKARLASYDDVAAAEARMRTLSKSAFEALNSMAQGSLGVAGSEGAVPANTPNPANPYGQTAILAGNLIASNPSQINAWATGTQRPTDQLADALTSRLATVTAPRTTAAAPGGSAAWGTG